MTLPLVPLPTSITEHEEAPVVLDAATRLVAEQDLATVAASVLGLPTPEAGDGAPSAEQTSPRSVVVLEERDEEDGLDPDGEAYLLRTGGTRVELTGTRSGLLRGLATLAQLSELDLPGAPRGQVPAVTIEDRPRLAHRGLMVDITRHFFGVPTLMKVIDLMAAYKLNVLHLHLSDDQGWRIEIPDRPELTEISGRTQVGQGPGGYLSVDEFAQLVHYAEARGIAVVPEIDMPGHVNAAQHAIGALTETGEPAEAYRGTEVGFSKLSLDNPATAPFIDDVLQALVKLTGGSLHVGGDEVHTMPRAEYEAFVEHLADAAIRAGSLPTFWGEAAGAELPMGTILQLWDSNADPAPIAAAARAGTRVVLSPGNRVYLDMQYYEGFPLGQHWAGYVEVRDSYDWDPAAHVDDLPSAAIEGVEAAIWTEWIITEDDLFTMLLPRLAAVAEVGWSAQEDRDWDGFAGRLRAHAPLWDAQGLAYHRSEQVF
ncbi:family 20 glycosylhydrolase [Ruania zhangjianzhongii]|uniref:family 20 glycosylhydrolase n=1 Tax=Ruania zhangjianzhongii TaxID=2603206 RepID=UPI00143DA11B|nr:family 20 glycosylhydrolase [Ruania zhangjianzhongii]